MHGAAAIDVALLYGAAAPPLASGAIKPRPGGEIRSVSLREPRMPGSLTSQSMAECQLGVT